MAGEGSAGLGGPGAALTVVPPLPRCFLLGEIEKEEKEKVWYYAQLQSLATRLDELPHVETVSRGTPAPPRGPGQTLPQPLTLSSPRCPPSSPCRWISSGSSWSSRHSTSAR